MGTGAKYVKGRLPVALVYYELFWTRSEAMRRENQIKKMSRANKLKLIESLEGLDKKENG
jgi:putative endonuclease